MTGTDLYNQQLQNLDFSHSILKKVNLEEANLTNVTITGNYTYPKEDFQTRGIGAGLIIGDNTTGTVLNCTIANNSAQFASGILNASESRTEIKLGSE